MVRLRLDCPDTPRLRAGENPSDNALRGLRRASRFLIPRIARRSGRVTDPKTHASRADSTENGVSEVKQEDFAPPPAVTASSTAQVRPDPSASRAQSRAIGDIFFRPTIFRGVADAARASRPNADVSLTPDRPESIQDATTDAPDAKTAPVIEPNAAKEGARPRATRGFFRRRRARRRRVAAAIARATRPRRPLRPKRPFRRDRVFLERLYGDHRGFARDARDPNEARCRARRARGDDATRVDASRATRAPSGRPASRRGDGSGRRLELEPDAPGFSRTHPLERSRPVRRAWAPSGAFELARRARRRRAGTKVFPSRLSSLAFFFRGSPTPGSGDSRTAVGTRGRSVASARESAADARETRRIPRPRGVRAARARASRSRRLRRPPTGA